MKTAEEKAKECIDNLIDSLSLEVNYEESNYDAGQVRALRDYGEEVYKAGFLEGRSNPNIKQLEWDGKEELAFFTAKTNIGEYMIDSPHRDGIFVLIYTPDWSYESFVLHTSDSVDKLKCFAQQDFEARVKECLITE